MLTKQAIINKMMELQYPANEYWLTTGAGLVMHGVKMETRDIDMGCSSLLAETLIQKGAKWCRLEDGRRRIEIDSDVELYENWFVDEIVSIDEISVASLCSIRKQKVELNREKDWEDIRLIDRFVATQETVPRAPALPVSGGNMGVHLIKATVDDSARIHEMQLSGFRALLDKYRDFDTNPGAETLERVRRRFSFDTVDHYFICLADEAIGSIRVQRLAEDVCRLSQMFILPDFQGKGYAQEAIRIAESLYPQARKWTLDTIKQEAKLCHLYEKMGYRLTGTGKHIKDGMDLVDYAKENG